MSEVEYPKSLELAMLAVQSKLTNPIKDTKNEFFKAMYATLPEIRNLVTPILAESGLYVTQLVNFDERAYLDTIITHAPTGKTISSKTLLMMDKQTPQGQGSAITYARRYALCAMLNIAQDDDDGQSAEKSKPEPKPDPITAERKSFIIDLVANETDVAKLRTLYPSIKKECQTANDEATWKQLEKVITDKVTQLQPPQENTNDTTN